MMTYALTIALALLAAAAPARAQDTTLGDARWAPWLGCWHLVHDDRGSRAPAATNSEDVLVCVLPESGNRGVWHDDIRWRPVGPAADDRGRWSQLPGERTRVQRQSEKRMVAHGPTAPHTRRHHMHRPARAYGVRDHAHGRRADVGGYPGCRHRSGRPGTRPPLPTNRPTPSGRGLAGRPPGTRDEPPPRDWRVQQR